MNKFFIFIVIVVVGVVAFFTFYQKKSNSAGAQETLSIIKPDAVAANQSGQIITQIEASGLQVIAIKMTQLSLKEAEQFYAVHKDRPFYRSLTEFMSSGPIIAMVLEGEQAVSTYRNLMGATDPQKAAAGTLRKQFATSVEHNAVHGSDSVENAEQEIAFFFTKNQIYPRTK